jgi:16S rRNA C967 or C1407 C5-methylase (RsmB/RsmF family)
LNEAPAVSSGRREPLISPFKFVKPGASLEVSTCIFDLEEDEERDVAPENRPAVTKAKVAVLAILVELEDDETLGRALLLMMMLSM